jgi:hypothetical protein
VNAVAWLYYLCLLVPAAAVGAMCLTKPRLPALDVATSRAVLITLTLYAGLLNHFLLRGNLAARFGDLGAPVAVIAAWLLSQAPPARTPRLLWRAALVLVGITAALAMNTSGSVWQELATSRLRPNPMAAVPRVVQVSSELGQTPPPRVTMPDEWERTRGAAAATIVDYLRACTGPNDRVLVMADAPEVLAFANRRFAGGHPTFRAGFYMLPQDQALTVARLERQSVPLVVTRDLDDYHQHIEPAFKSVVAWVDQRYEFRGELPALTGGPMRVLVRRDMLASAPFGNTGLPCPY